MTFECSLDNGRYTSCGRGQSGQWVGANVQHGQHSFKVKGTDIIGNTVEAEVRGWMVDAIPPIITYTSSPTKTNSSPEITWISSEQAEFECRIDNQPYTKCGQEMNGRWTEDNLSDGIHRLYVRGRDAVGNLGREFVHTWTVGTILKFIVNQRFFL